MTERYGNDLIRRFSFSLTLLLCTISSGCRSVAPLSTADLNAPGWSLQQGQVVWRRNLQSPEIAGDIVIASHPDGAELVEFSKNPFPILTAQKSSSQWRIEFTPERREFSGRGSAPKRLIWFYLPSFLQGNPPTELRNWIFEKEENGKWRLENKLTGEKLEGYVSK